MYKNSSVHNKVNENTFTIYHKDLSHIIGQQTVNIYIHLYYGFDICMIHNINIAIATAPKIPRTHPAVVVDDDAVKAFDLIIVQNVVLS